MKCSMYVIVTFGAMKFDPKGNPICIMSHFKGLQLVGLHCSINEVITLLDSCLINADCD